MKKVAYLIHIPTLLLGAILATLWIGLKTGFEATVDFWIDIPD